MKDISHLMPTLGLNEHEAKIYLACLELGGSSVQDISRETGIKRTTVYNFLEELRARGLVSQVKKGGRTLLLPEDPHVFIQKAEQHLREIKNAVPELMSVFNLPSSKPNIRFYQGVDGLRHLYEDTLVVGEKIYGFGDFDKVIAVMGDYIWDYVARRVKKNIDYQVIAKRGDWLKDPHVHNERQLRNFRLVGATTKFDTEIDIYGGKIAIYSFRKPYAGIIIEDHAVAETMKSVWKLLWEALSEGE